MADKNFSRSSWKRQGKRGHFSLTLTPQKDRLLKNRKVLYTVTVVFHSTACGLIQASPYDGLGSKIILLKV